jgi:Fe2+ transport system protein FeoA
MTIFGITLGNSRNAVSIHASALLPPRHLAEIEPGQKGRVIGFSARLDRDRKTHLQAYGVVPGRIIKVVQHSPVTVIQVEHTELALERELAREIEIEVV